MISFLSFGKHKKEKEHEDFSEVFPELNQLKQQIDSSSNISPFEPPTSNFPYQPTQNIEQQPNLPPLVPQTQQALPLPKQEPIQPTQTPSLPPLQAPPTFQPIETEETQKITPQDISKPISKETKLFEEEQTKPEIYIKIDKYKEVLSLLSKISSKLKEIENDLLELKNLKSKELERLNFSRKELEESKNSIDKVLSILKGF